MKLVCLFLLLTSQLFIPSNSLSQSINEETIYDSNELIRFSRKPLDDSLYLISQSSKFGIRNSDGKILVPVEYDQIKVDFKYREELLLLEIYTSENEEFYFFWEKGNESQALYEELLKQELDKPKSPLNLENKFREAPYFVAQKGELWGVINSLNEVLIPLEYNSIEGIGQDILLAKKNNMFNILTPDNRILTTPCDTVLTPYLHSRSLPYGTNFAAYAVLIEDNRYGAINLFNGELVQPKYDGLEYCSQLPEDHFPCSFNPQDICLNCSKEQRMRNHHYYNVLKYKSGNKVGLLDMMRIKELTPPSYNSIRIMGSWQNQIIQLDSLYTFMTNENMRLHEGRYDSVSYLTPNMYFKIYSSGSVGVYSFNGDQVLKTEWQDVTSVFGKENSFCFVVKYKGKYGVVDEYGRLIVRTKYDKIEHHYDKESRRRYLFLERKGKMEEIDIKDL